VPTTADLLRALAAVLHQRGHRWYVFGAQALAVHGRARHTDDVDVTVECPPTEARVLWSALEDAGFRMRVAEPERFLARTHVLPLTWEPGPMDLDLILAGSGLEQLFLSRANMHDLGGVTVPVLTAEDLVIAKVLAQRPKDLEDVRSVLRAQPTLDLAHVRRVLRDLEEALQQSDLLPVLEDLVAAGATGPR
jgi:hypothetical protein